MQPNEPSEHHFVPKMYLNNFCYLIGKQKRIYAFPRAKIHLPVPNKFNSYTPKQICKENDLYLIKDTNVMKNFGVNDANQVEKRAFLTFENNFNKILAKVCTRPVTNSVGITLQEATIFIQTLLRAC
ncbi:hypothetical protein BH09BAC4_BH09BAC4_30510 [soil metagenome]